MKQPSSGKPKEAFTSTFSIAAYSPDENAWGVAVASKFLCVGAVVPFARAGAGAVATQSLANLSYGPDGLDLMAGGLSAEETIQRLTGPDEQASLRQVGMVDASGKAATFTGNDCFDWAGGLTGDGYAIQGNILTGADVVQAMETAFLQTQGAFAQRLYMALFAGDRAGGDKRGRQSAGIVVVKPGGSYGGYIDRYMDLRVDDHRNPVEELGRLMSLHHIFLGDVHEDARMPIDNALAAELQSMLVKQGYYTGQPSGTYDDATRQALETFVNTENLEHRVDVVKGLLDPPALEYIRSTFMTD